MQNEPTEISPTTSATRTRISPRRPEQPTAEILDAAFDDYRRVDVANPSNDKARPEHAGMTKALLADISTQLDILDRQREQLAALLRDVNL